MDALETILTRTTATALADPGPDRATLGAALEAAAAAPDHGRIRPWRFIIIEGEHRHRLGDIFAEALARREPATSERELQRERERALRSPLVVVAVARVVPDHPKVPEIEQIAAASAAVQNMLLALHAKGFGSMWKTGPAAYDSLVHRALALEPGDRILGFVYIGTPAGRPAVVRRGDWREVTRDWEPAPPS